MMNIKKKCAYDLVAPTSMGIRITPADRQPVHMSRQFSMQATSAESNAASIPASLGMRVKLLTRFVQDSPIALFIKSDLKSRGIEFEGKDVPQGGPWGYRHQFNIADSGFGMRGPAVLNDRAGEIGRTLSAGDFDLERLFGVEGVRILHLSGLIAALSPETGRFCLDLADAAKKHGASVSFDLNYRASFWKGREKELRDVFIRIAQTADILIGNEEDFQLSLGMPGPEAGGKDIADKIGSFQAMIECVRQVCPNAAMFATTLRQVVSSNEHLWGAVLLSGSEWHVVQPRSIAVFDRIGGGDGFVGGMLYGLLKGWDAKSALHFGWASGALAATLATDYALPASEDEIWSIWEGNARVKR